MGFFATEETGIAVNGILYSHTSEGVHQLGLQLYGITVCAGWSAFVSYLLLQFLDFTVGLRVTEKEEDDGLDVSLHGETIILKGDHFEHRISTTAAAATSAHSRDLSPASSSDGGSSGANGGTSGGTGGGAGVEDTHTGAGGTPRTVTSDVGTGMELYEQAMGRVLLEPLHRHPLNSTGSSGSSGRHHYSAAAAGVDVSEPSDIEMKEFKSDDFHTRDVEHKTVTFATV